VAVGRVVDAVLVVCIAIDDRHLFAAGSRRVSIISWTLPQGTSTIVSYLSTIFSFNNLFRLTNDCAIAVVAELLLL